ncbi:hypothetical protein [Mycobacteroides chelonae]|uniref:hypothetical protein n=1 Tax=Mycobacteroides chelonae TaxID=1774 RepID=UPI001C2C7BFE|nr:hypothetical protein [Mycobacteroides chelonae]MBV0917949.1 hypothetical protein [Mycobacteroides chelonae]MEC4903383.1 hypothetical protein [Mycobacteroides chelonae]
MDMAIEYLATDDPVLRACQAIQYLDGRVKAAIEEVEELALATILTALTDNADLDPRMPSHASTLTRVLMATTAKVALAEPLFTKGMASERQMAVLKKLWLSSLWPVSLRDEMATHAC